MILGFVPLSSCKVECDRRRTAKLIQPSPSGSKRGRTHRRRTLSGSSGVTISSLGNTHPSWLWSGRVEIHLLSRSKISGATPTSRISSVLVLLISPLYHDLCTRIAPCATDRQFVAHSPPILATRRRSPGRTPV